MRHAAPEKKKPGLDLAPQSVSRLLRELGLSARDGLDAIRIGYLRRLRAEAGNAGQSPERRELLVARRRLLDLEFKRRMRQLVPADWSTRLLAGAGTVARTHLEVADRRIRAAHPGLPEDVLATIRKQHQEAVSAIADAITTFEQDEKEETK